jgi:hypothetical protein
VKHQQPRATNRILLILALCVVVLVGSAQAQDTPTSSEMPPVLSTLEVSLWPEFDRPDVLVINRGLLAADAGLPAPVEIRIPASARRR